ncbi:MAG TPA: NUDIX hydrolase [Candidatus Choladousia intestinigallinarum]|nr:NUDIX hydrolase [Candidatus Choladousia intestinigallinarum]
MRQNIYSLLQSYRPDCEQERMDLQVMLEYTEKFDNVLERENHFGHFTASPWIINEDGSRVLLVYHRIYDSWGWCGGHCDGDENFHEVAVREGREETGLGSIRHWKEPAEILSVEILPVPPHVRRGEFVTSHVHLNLTYLCVADEREPLHHREEETRGAMWVPAEEVGNYVSAWDRDMLSVYEKLIHKTKKLYNA